MKTVHVVGDSISIQYGPYLEKYLGRHGRYSRKEDKIGNMELPEGANGGDSAMVLDYLRLCAAEELHWDLLVINCGLHDIKRYNETCQINVADYEHNLRQIYEQAACMLRSGDLGQNNPCNR